MSQHECRSPQTKAGLLRRYVRNVKTRSCTSDFLLLMDVNGWINGECAECPPPHLNVSDCFTCSHPSKGENCTRDRSEIVRVNGPLEFVEKLEVKIEDLENLWIS